MSSLDHRQALRVPVCIPVRIRYKGEPGTPGVALNISRGGVFIATVVRPRRNVCGTVRMRLPAPNGGRVVEIPGLVVHRSANGIGMMFRELDQRTEELVCRLVETARRSESEHERGTVRSLFRDRSSRDAAGPVRPGRPSSDPQGTGYPRR